MQIIFCINWGEWRWRAGDTLVLHHAVIQHHPQCDGNCDATDSVEQARSEGRLVGKPRHKIRAATNG